MTKKEKLAYVLEDYTNWQNILREMLTGKGFEVVVAGTIAELLALTEQPNFISLDGNLPDGKTLARLPEIQAQFPHAVLVFVSADSDVETYAAEHAIPVFSKTDFSSQEYLKVAASSENKDSDQEQK